jgi:DNA topoisomerase-2
VASFTNEAAFNRWWEVQPTSTQKRCHVKYYKGLATSTVMESKEYFVNIDKHQLFIDCTDPADIALLNQFFSGKDDTDARKQMITELDPLDYEVDYTSGSIRLRQFLLGELLSFSCDNNARSLPCAIDGLKPSQRKILYVLLQQKIFKPDMKVAQLQGLVAKNTLYAHAEDTLGTTARTMAGEHNHNINLLVPEGNFGNRHGDEPGATRYIFTCAEPIARALFPAEDDFVLDRLTCEGELVEPNYMVPVIALVLCNGASGLGTGFACSVPACDVEQVLRWTRAHVAARRAAAAATDSTGQGTEDEDTGADAADAEATDGAAEATTDPLAACPPPEIPCPHLNMFGGKSVEVTPGRTWAFKGVVTRPESHVFRVTDLPMETNNFHKAAVKALGPLLKYTTPNNTDVKVDMTYVLHGETDVATVDAMWQKLQKLATLNVSAGNMYLWDADTKLRKFRSFEDILRHHADVRFARYSRRKAHQIEQLQQKIAELDDKCKFINAVIQDPAVLHNRRSDEVEAWLESGGFARVNGTFAHLLSMHISSTTAEMLERLRENCAWAAAQLAVLRGRSEMDLWDADLDVLGQAYQDFLATREARHRAPSAPFTAAKPSPGEKTQSRGVKRGATGQASAAKRKKAT